MSQQDEPPTNNEKKRTKSAKRSSKSTKSKSSKKGAKVTITRAKTPDHERRAVVQRLESGGRILSLIKKAETKRVAKRKIITFLKKKGVSEHKIIEAYSAYYNEEGLYEITFNERPLGFSVIMDTRGKNAIVSSVQDEQNGKLGMKVASRVYEVNGKRVDDVKHKEILKMISQQPTPFYVVFKESRKKNAKLAAIKKKVDKGMEWQDPDKMSADEASEDEESCSTSYSYSSDDDEAHVAHHYSRKNVLNIDDKHRHSKKKKKKKQTDDKGLFKPHEMDQWDQSRLQDEQAAMLKELSRLMMGAVASADQKGPAEQAQTSLDVDGMTHKRQHTLKTLIDITASNGSQNEKESSRTFSVTDLDVEDEEYDPEIFKYLSELVGENDVSMRPLTPSTNKIMKDLFIESEQDEIALNLPDFGARKKKKNNHSVQHSNSTSNTSNTSNGTNSTNNGYQNPYVPYTPNEEQNMQQNPYGDEKKDDDDVIQSLEDGTTLLKYGKYGKPKYKMFHLTPDHKYLVWFSQKKSSDETRIKMKEIKKIAIGSKSKVVEKTKKKELHETSFTIFYGKSNNEKEQKQLTVTAKNEKEAFVWAQGLKILSDAAKNGKHLRTLSKTQMASDSDIDTPKRHHKTKSVIISMEQIHRQSVLNVFSKSNESSINSLIKQHGRLKQQLQKCVDFVMTKSNYRAIAHAGQFDKVKTKLEDLDNRLREIKHELTTNVDDAPKELSGVKAELFSCNADLDALKQKLTAIVRRPQKL